MTEHNGRAVEVVAVAAAATAFSKQGVATTIKDKPKMQSFAFTMKTKP